MPKRAGADVPDAGSGGGTGPARPNPPTELRDKRKWPKYTAAEQSVIRGYLLAYEAHCQEALDRAEGLRALDPEDAYAQAMVLRWRYGAQVCRWMLSRLDLRQRHLAYAQYLDKQTPAA